MYLEMGKFGIPAKHHEAISMIYSKVDHLAQPLITNDLRTSLTSICISGH